MGADVDVLEAVRLAAMRARLLERHGLSRWADLFGGSGMQYYPELGQVYDTDEGTVEVIDEWDDVWRGKHMPYWRVRLSGVAELGVPKTSMGNFLGLNNAQLRKGE